MSRRCESGAVIGQVGAWGGGPISRCYFARDIVSSAFEPLMVQRHQVASPVAAARAMCTPVRQSSPRCFNIASVARPACARRPAPQFVDAEAVVRGSALFVGAWLIASEDLLPLWSLGFSWQCFSDASRVGAALAAFRSCFAGAHASLRTFLECLDSCSPRVVAPTASGDVRLAE